MILSSAMLDEALTTMLDEANMEITKQLETYGICLVVLRVVEEGLRIDVSGNWTTKEGMN